MPRAHYSVVLNHPAARVWSVIRGFDQYAWAGVAGETVLEEGKGSTEVGAVRCISLPNGDIRRQLLLAHSDLERSYSYTLCPPDYLPVTDYQATLRVMPVTASDQAFVEWWATFECRADDRAKWVAYFEHDGFAVWLAALRRHLELPA